MWKYISRVCEKKKKEKITPPTDQYHSFPKGTPKKAGENKTKKQDTKHEGEKKEIVHGDEQAEWIEELRRANPQTKPNQERKREKPGNDR